MDRKAAVSLLFAVIASMGSLYDFLAACVNAELAGTEMHSVWANRSCFRQTIDVATKARFFSTALGVIYLDFVLRIGMGPNFVTIRCIRI